MPGAQGSYVILQELSDILPIKVQSVDGDP